MQSNAFDRSIRIAAVKRLLSKAFLQFLISQIKIWLALSYKQAQISLK